ncbi:hypothetical protein ACL9RI_01550 [Janthinobacterium sp. Mn2066]|uniref:hypothetical protein n=1 Tax=Janthinobacterium sp. Mn2066 TaxID=3395264 RepID=UPI003BE7A1D2
MKKWDELVGISMAVIRGLCDARSGPGGFGSLFFSSGLKETGDQEVLENQHLHIGNIEIFLTFCNISQCLTSNENTKKPTTKSLTMRLKNASKILAT